jgi:hypothetical protein
MFGFGVSVGVGGETYCGMEETGNGEGTGETCGAGPDYEDVDGGGFGGHFEVVEESAGEVHEIERLI